MKDSRLHGLVSSVCWKSCQTIKLSVCNSCKTMCRGHRECGEEQHKKVWGATADCGSSFLYCNRRALPTFRYCHQRCISRYPDARTPPRPLSRKELPFHEHCKCPTRSSPLHACTERNLKTLQDATTETEQMTSSH